MKRVCCEGGDGDCGKDEKVCEASKRRKIEVKTGLKPLQDLNAQEVDELKNVCTDAEVMRYVRDSKPWTPAYVEKLCEWARKDAMEAADPKKKNSEDSRVEYWHWAIVENEVEDKKETPVVTAESKEDKRGDEEQQKKGETGEEEREKPVMKEENSGVRGVVVGYVGLRPVQRSNPPVLQVRVFISREHQHRGHAKRALQLVKTFADENLSWCSEIQSFVRQDNNASIELFTRAGWQRRGVKWFGRECENVFYMPLHNPAPSSDEKKL